MENNNHGKGALPKAKFTKEQKLKLAVVGELMELSTRNDDLNCPTVLKLFASCLTEADATRPVADVGSFPYFLDKIEADESQRLFLRALFARVAEFVITNHPVPNASEQSKYASILMSVGRNLQNNLP